MEASEASKEIEGDRTEGFGLGDQTGASLFVGVLVDLVANVLLLLFSSVTDVLIGNDSMGTTREEVIAAPLFDAGGEASTPLLPR